MLAGLRVNVTEFEPKRLFMLSVYLLVMGLLLGYLAEQQKHLRAEKAVITRTLAKVRVEAGLTGTLASDFFGNSWHVRRVAAARRVAGEPQPSRFSRRVAEFRTCDIGVCLAGFRTARGGYVSCTISLETCVTRRKMASAGRRWHWIVKEMRWRCLRLSLWGD